MECEKNKIESDQENVLRVLVLYELYRTDDVMVPCRVPLAQNQNKQITHTDIYAEAEPTQ